MVGLPSDLFKGLEDEVPFDLGEYLRVVPVVDHHVHGYFTSEIDRGTFEEALNEGSTDAVPPYMSTFDSSVGVAIRRWCAPLLGLPPLTTADEYWAARTAMSPDELARTLLAAAGVETWLVDTGFQGLNVSSPGGLAEIGGGTAQEIVRLEALMETMLGEGVDPVDFPGAFRGRLSDVSADTVAVKTIAAYRSGFDIEWERPHDEAVVSAAGDLVRGRGQMRVADPSLIAFGVYAAADAGLPIQVHVGYGDHDVDLHKVDPLLMLPLLRQMPPVPVLLLHCYPFHRHAAYLAQAFDQVHFDVGLAVNYLGSSSVQLVGEAMELAPWAKQLYSSDAFGIPELHVLGSILWRRGMGRVLGGWVRRGDWLESDAIRAIEMIARKNAVRVYGLGT